MINLYFGNIPNSLSTILFFIFGVHFVKTKRNPEGEKKWKKAALITMFIGLLMSALSGVKDSFADKEVVSFKQMNIPLMILCSLGGIATLFGIVAGLCKKESINKVIFYILSIIIIAKTAVVETLRIVNYFGD